MPTNKNLREIKRYAESLGLTMREVSRNRHIKVVFTDQRGREATSSIAVSASDFRAKRQIEAQLRRFANGGEL